MHPCIQASMPLSLFLHLSQTIKLSIHLSIPPALQPSSLYLSICVLFLKILYNSLEFLIYSYWTASPKYCCNYHLANLLWNYHLLLFEWIVNPAYGEMELHHQLKNSKVRNPLNTRQCFVSTDFVHFFYLSLFSLGRCPVVVFVVCLTIHFVVAIHVVIIVAAAAVVVHASSLVLIIVLNILVYVKLGQVYIGDSSTSGIGSKCCCSITTDQVC